MAILDIDGLLQGLAADAPCGPNMEYEPEFMALQEMARGKPEQVIGDRVRPAEPPAWDRVGQAAQQVLKQTKDLRVAGILYVAMLKTRGLQGVVSGLGLLAGLLQQYWPYLHPQLEDGDPEFRVNALMDMLANEDALATLRSIPLVTSRQFGGVTLRAQRIARGALKVSTEECADPAQEAARIQAALADSSPESLGNAASLLDEAEAHLRAIQQILQEKAGGVPGGITPLLADIKELQAVVAARLGKRAVVTSGPVTTNSPPAVVPVPVPAAASGEPAVGEIRNSTDVLAALQRICDYYKRCEPSSPVPLILERAARLVNKDFMAILRDLAPAGVNEAEVVGGLVKRDS